MHNLNANARISISVSPEEIQSEPKVAVKTELGKVELHFDPDTYAKFLRIGETLRLESEILKLLQTDKAQLLKDNKKIDTAFYFSEKVGKWKLHYLILSGAYVYFYETNKQLYPSSYYYLTNASVKDEGKSEALGLFMLSVINKYGEVCRLGFRKPEQKTEWLRLLGDYVKDFYEPQKPVVVSVVPAEGMPRKPVMHVSFMKR